MIIKFKPLRQISVLLLLATLSASQISAIKDANFEVQGWGGVNLATKSTFSTNFSNATFVQPAFGATAWASQPFILPDAVDFGISVGYQPIFSQTAGTGTVSSVTTVPVLLEARYRFGNGIFAAVGAGYAWTRLKLNDTTSGTNSAVLSAKGGYQYDILKNLSAVGTVQASYLLQSITFPGVSSSVSNSQVNFTFTLGVAYKI